jgi:pyruvate dehydrogenase E2 component (dihydrolipoamide acetyltransferase)
MPALSPTMTQGNIGTWQKSVGDQLSPGEVLVTIETDKAQVDFEFQEDGYLAKILVETGTKDVDVGKPIGVYVEDQSDVAAFENFSVEDAGAAAPAAPKEATKPPKEEAKSESEPVAPASEIKSTPVESASVAAASSDERIKASPVAKLIALENNIPLKDVKGSGPDGRIIKRDVENYKPPTAAATTPSDKKASKSGAVPAPTSSGPYKDIPISQMRKTIALRLQASKVNSPHYVISSTVSVTKLLKLRAFLNDDSDGSYKISVNDLLIKAIGIANTKVPQVNTSWLEAEGVLRQYRNVDVSVAVATPTGLITPVVKSVNQKGLAQISNEIKELGKRAREGNLYPEEYQGGTVTISNLGMNPAVSFFTAIINPPQSGILAVGTTERRAIEDPESQSGITFDDVINITASFDHRVVDGAIGAEWIKALKLVLETPLKLLL